MEPKSRSLEEIKTEILRRAGKINPFEGVQRQEVEGLVGRLSSLDPDLWGSEWGKLGRKYELLGDEQERRGGREQAGKTYFQAFEYYRIGRYPVPSSPEKMKNFGG